jgi:hypothetical protein
MVTLQEYLEYRRARHKLKEILSEDNHNFW